MADLFNEPHRASWHTTDGFNDWSRFASTVGDAVLEICPRWLVAVQGVGSSWECIAASGSRCWWGENLLGQRTSPIELVLPHRLVLSPHLYGHDLSREYMQAAEFPRNLKHVWDKLWGECAVRNIKQNAAPNT